MLYRSRPLLAVLALVAVSSAHAVTIADLAGDFHIGTNAGPWTYGYTTDPLDLSQFGLYDSNTTVSATYSGKPIEGWSSTTSPTGVYPYAAYNTGDWSGYGINFQHDTVLLHPGNAASHLYSVARYTAGSNLGYVKVDSLFTRLENGNQSSYGVYKNGILVGGGNASGVDQPFAVNGIVSLSTGDRLDVVVGPGNDQYYGDVNQVSARISSVPGPAGALVFGLGFLRRRRR